MIALGLNYAVVTKGGSFIGHSDNNADYDCIIVLGAGIYYDMTPTPMLQDRLDTAIRLYNEGAAPKLLLSGDNGQEEYNEVEAMRQYAVDAGVKEEDIFLDYAGFSTYETMYRAMEVFNVRSAIVVTQPYHEYRALYIADKLGMEPLLGVSADFENYQGNDKAGDFYRSTREILARDKDFVKCIFRPEPTFLGEVIDIHGEGNAKSAAKEE